jgi:very-short-patch-repair endonuclease
VHPQIGIAGFFIDLAIADPERPGRYLLGIECDGASYHSSRSARDRDRLRQAVLEDHGWIIHRIWSTDWFRRPKEQLERTVAAIEQAKQLLGERAEQRRRAVPVQVVTVEREDRVEIGLEEVGARTEHRVAAYVEASFPVPSQDEIHVAPVGVLADIARRVVEVEGPVHLMEVTARIRTMWGLQRAGGRIQAAVERAVNQLVRGRLIDASDGFLSLPGAVPTVRDRSAVGSVGLRQPSMLPPAELQAAIETVIRSNLGATNGEVVLSVSRMLGFKATSAQLKAVIDAVTARMVASGAIADVNGHLQMVVREGGTSAAA